MSLARQNMGDAANHLFDTNVEQEAANSAVFKPAISVECVNDVRGFAALRTEWDGLHERAENASVFMSWAWHHTWWSVFGDKNELCLLCARLNGKLVGLMPLYIRQYPWPMANQVWFLGTGEGEADEVSTEYLDVLADAEHAPLCASLMLGWLDEHCPSMVFNFQQLLESANLFKALQLNNDEWVLKLEHRGFRYQLDTHQQTSDIPMVESRLKRVKRSLRAVERDGGMTQVSVFDRKHVNDVLKDVSELSDQRQQHAKRAKSAFASERFKQFHHRILPLLYQLDGADVQHFYLNDELCAVLYCFYDKTTCHYYQSGFVQSMANRYMPLTVAHLMEIERNREAGRRYYDFMRGDADSYKKEFNCDTTPMVNIVRFPSEGYRRVRETFTISRQRVVKELKRVGVSRKR